MCVPYFLLLLSLQKMDKRNFNGPDFKYRVMWRRVLGSGPTWHTHYTTAPPFTVDDIGNFSAFEIKVQAVNEKGEGPEPDPVIGYSGEDGKIKKWLIAVQSFFFYLEYFLVYFLTCGLSYSVSSLGGANGCGCCTVKQHYHQSDLGSSKEGNSQRTPTGIQGTEPVPPLLFGKTHPAIVLMNNTCTVFHILVWQRLQSCL